MAVTYGAGGKVVLFAAASDAITGLQKVRDIYWIKPANAGDDLVVTNSADKVICSMTGQGNTDQKREVREWVNGVKIGTLDSGAVEVVLE